MTNEASQAQRSKRRAAKVGLRYVSEFDDGICRRRCGRGFTYLSPTGRTIKAKSTRQRIATLAIPPAWQEVWICPDPHGHIQARGRDNAGRIQYIYHQDWQVISSVRKFDRMSRFAQVLPRIRRRVRTDLNHQDLPPQRVMAAIVRLLDKAQLRVGNNESVKARGATTLTSRHVSLEGFRVSLDFPGKSNRRREVEFTDKKVAKVIQRCEEIDGQYLFEYLDDKGESRRVDSTAINRYLQEIAGEKVTAKDFRTWWGSAIALAELMSLPADARPRTRRAATHTAVKAAAASLGNTVAVCRSSYVHPGILAAAESGELPKLIASCNPKPISELRQTEVLLTAILPKLEFT